MPLNCLERKGNWCYVESKTSSCFQPLLVHLTQPLLMVDNIPPYYVFLNKQISLEIFTV